MQRVQDPDVTVFDFLVLWETVIVGMSDARGCTPGYEDDAILSLEETESIQTYLVDFYHATWQNSRIPSVIKFDDNILGDICLIAAGYLFGNTDQLRPVCFSPHADGNDVCLMVSWAVPSAQDYIETVTKFD